MTEIRPANPPKPAPNPEARFGTPWELVRDPKLTLVEKRRILAEWEDDVRELLVASEEGMTGPQKQVTLADILEAKASLPIDTPPRPESPSKA